MRNSDVNNYRNSGVNVLGYFRKHILRYAILCDWILTKGRMASIDRGLYRALLRNGKIDEAIPQVYNRLLDASYLEQKRILRDLHEECNHNASAASRRSGLSLPTVLTYWKEMDLETLPRGKPRQSKA